MKRTLFLLIPLIGLSQVQALSFQSISSYIPGMPELPSVALDLNRITPEWAKTVGNSIATTTKTIAGNSASIVSNICSVGSSVAIGTSEIGKKITDGVAKIAETYPQAAAITALSTAAATTAASAAYAVYCRRWSKHWQKQVDLIKNNYTNYLSTASVDQNNKPDKLMFWNNAVEGYERPENILSNKATVYKKLLLDRKKSGENEKNTVERLMEEIRIEKKELLRLEISLRNCLKESRFIPTLLDSNTWIEDFINHYMTKVCAKRDIKDLTLDQEKLITRALEREQSLMNPYNIFRRLSFPSEMAANMQYWKLNLLISRLNALYDVLNEKLPTL